MGRAGPYGPVFNQDGIRWAQPFEYLNQTFTINSIQFFIAWFAANFLLLVIIFILISGGWKIFNIYRMKKKGTLWVSKFFRSKNALFLIIGLTSILIAFVALFLPWYNISAYSETGPLAQEEPVNIVSINGINGITANLFFGAGESTSGYRHIYSAQLPLSIIFAASLILLPLDIIAIKSRKKLGKKFIIGAILYLTPFILTLIFITQLPAILSWATTLMPGQQFPSELETLVSSIASNPLAGTITQNFEVVGLTIVAWGFGFGAYLFLIAGIVRIISGILILRRGEFVKQHKQLN